MRSSPMSPLVSASAFSSLSGVARLQERGTKAADGKSNSSPVGRAPFGDGRWQGDWTPGSRSESCCGFCQTCSGVDAQAAARGLWWSGGRQLGSSLQ